VCNKGQYVEIFAQGEQGQVEEFLRLLEHEPPRRAAILKVDVKSVTEPPKFTDFAIVESEMTRG
jgi:hydrogenase maturation protein HypF